MDICSETGCGRTVTMRGLCRKCYSRKRRRGEITVRPTRPHGEKEAWLIANLGYAGDECLIWPFDDCRTEGVVYINGQNMTAARGMCIVKYGPPPFEKAHAAHRCGKGSSGCVAPLHVRWATPQENDADKDTHGTRPKGEAHGTAVLTEEHVRAVLIDNRSAEKLALVFDCSPTAIRAIRQGRTWSWLTGIKRKAA